MVTSDPYGVFIVAHDRGCRLRAEASTERLRLGGTRRRAVAAFLRRAADRLDAGALSAPTARGAASRP